ncbi:MAG: GNAT family N-acetyltransferase [Reyranellaceae bacterium]
MTASLATPSLLLRAVRTEDLAALAGLLHRPQVRRFLLDDRLVPLDWIEEQIAASGARFAGGSLGLFAAFERLADRPLVGIAGGIAGEEGGQPELIYALAPAFQGRGLGREMMAAVIGFAFETLHWQRLCASVDRPNLRSVALLERLGFARTGGEGDEEDAVLKYALTRG